MMINALTAASGNMSETMTTALNTAFTGVKTDVLSVIETSLPIGLAIFGTVLAISLGIKFFGRISKKN